MIAMNICMDCDAEFTFDESPVDEHCVHCLAWREWYYGEQEVLS